ncbi:MAG: Rrf2 family transcriptional regulator [Acidaminococcaceae bacterium]|nr:Rrf2 family transcriptional regulator [Acidaminococcaceae bacterium]MDD4721769.1 Rrf2 family transcriptional regulator [Acidaminococcaceae bacterium]
MRVSTKGRYALRVMLYLAEHYTFGYISVKDIAKEEDLSPKYVEQIMCKLTKASLIMAVRGAHGGYRLTNSPSHYSVGQIIKATESYTEFAPCANSDGGTCPRYKKCISADVWQLVQSTVEELLNNLTLTDLLRMQQNKLGTPSLYLTYLPHLKKID